MPLPPLKRVWIALVLCSPVASVIWAVRHHSHSPPAKTHPRQTARPASRSIAAALDQSRRDYDRGDFARAQVSLNRAISEAHALGDRASEAKALVGIAACQLDLFNYREALKKSDAGRKLAEEVGDQVTIGASWINRSSVFSNLGDFESAKDAAIHAVAALDHSERPDLLVRALLLEGRLYAAAKDAAKAKDIYIRAASVAAQLKSLRWKQLFGTNMGRHFS